MTKPTPQAPATSDATRRPPTGWIIGGVIALIAIIAGVVVLTTGDDDEESDTAPAVTAAPGAEDTVGGETDIDDTAPTTAAGDTTPPASAATGELEQTRPVTFAGTPLPPYDKDADVDAGVGMQAPTLTGASFDGTPVTVAPGKATLLVFLAHWCPHCQREVPRLVEWQADGEVPEGLDVIGVATGTTDTAPNYPPSEWLEGEGWPFPTMADDADQTAAIVMGIPSYPYFVLLHPDGTVAWRLSGEIDTDDLTAEIEAALAAQLSRCPLGAAGEQA